MMTTLAILVILFALAIMFFLFELRTILLNMLTKWIKRKFKTK